MFYKISVWCLGPMSATGENFLVNLILLEIGADRCHSRVENEVPCAIVYSSNLSTLMTTHTGFLHTYGTGRPVGSAGGYFSFEFSIFYTTIICINIIKKVLFYSIRKKWLVYY